MKTQTLFHAKNLPVFQNKVFNTAEEAKNAPQANLRLVQDLHTGLIFNADFNPDLLTYDRDYQNEQAYSASFQQHLRDVTSIISKHFQGLSLIEVGCGKGYFLEYLKQKGFHITGIDPAYEGDNPDVITALFEPELGVQAEAIVLRHVLEHMQHPLAFLQNIAKANANQGYIYIEVPCFRWICQHHAWFDIFYEHVNYFCLDDFQRMFSNISDMGYLFGGQYIYVVAKLDSLRTPRLARTNPFAFPQQFTSALTTHAQHIIQSQPTASAIWGGSSKGVIFALYMQRHAANIDMVIDINPAKQNKFLAGSGIQILSPDMAMVQLETQANVFVMNSNYIQEIITLSNNNFNYIQVEKS